MTIEDKVADNYAHGALVEAMRAGLARIGKTPETVTPDDLAPVEDMHVGWRQATETFLAQMGFAAGARVLDIGSGLGGRPLCGKARWRTCDGHRPGGGIRGHGA